MPATISRRTFLQTSTFGVAASLACGLGKRHPAPPGPPDLEADLLPHDLLPPLLQQRAAAAERTGPLSDEYYAIHVWTAQSRFGPNGRLSDPVAGEGAFAQVAEEVNGWITRQLAGRRLRFIWRGELPVPAKLPLPDGGQAGMARALLEAAATVPDFGAPQRVQLILVRDAPALALSLHNSIILGWPDQLTGPGMPSLAPRLAHLIGHALGLAHPRPDIDTDGTEWASQVSFMHPNAEGRRLADSLILDSPLNPEKARLLRTGFFPFAGVIHTQAAGATPLLPGLLIEGTDRELRIAHGNYVLPAACGQAAVTIRGSSLTVDLGGALIRGDVAGFAEFGEHQTHGIGFLLTQAGQGALTLRGGIITGYHYGVKADGLSSGCLEGVTVVDNRRLPGDPRRAADDKARGVWLDFWLTPQEDATEFWFDAQEGENAFGAMGAGIALVACRATACRRAIATFCTVGVADYFGESNRYEDNDFGGCAMGLRLWQARGTQAQPISVLHNRFRFNTQPEPWWWSQGDSAAIEGVGVRDCLIQDNEIAFAGDGVFLSGFPRLPGRTQGIVIRGNRIAHCFAHGVELDFCQDCTLEDNRIADNWLSGVWAGHTAGLLAWRNSFIANNRGRKFAGWTYAQGAISCPQGRVSIVGNLFEGNWVAVNLNPDHNLSWWLFSGDATRHAVVGNIFRSNRVAVRLDHIRMSEITGNLMRDNDEDLIGDPAGNLVANNGPEVDPPVGQTLFFPVDQLLFDAGCRDISFRVLLVDGQSVTTVLPDEVLVSGAGPVPWLEPIVATDGTIRLLAQSAEPAARAAEVEIVAGGLRWPIPAKAMSGDFQVVVGRGNLDTCPAEDLGSSPVGPAAIFGTFPRLSDILRSTRPTSITGAEPFWCRFTQPGFAFSAHDGKALAVALTDGVAELFLGAAEPVFIPPPPDEDQQRAWTAKLLDLNAPPSEWRLHYLHGPELAEQGMPAWIAVWLYPLGDDEIERLDAATAQAAGVPPSADGLLSMPGGRRFRQPFDSD